MRTRTTALFLLAVVATGLAACSSPSDGASGGGDTRGTASGGAVPAADVVSGVQKDAKLAQSLPADVTKAGQLTYGTTLQPGTSGLPYGGTIAGKDVGLQKDLIDAVAKLLGTRAVAVNGTFPTIVPGVQNHKFDIGLDNFGVTAEREKVVDFATYLNDGQSFLGSKDVKITKATKISDICGLTVATAPGSTFQQLLETGKNDCSEAGKKPFTVRYFSTNAPIILGLQNGTVDVQFGPTLSLSYALAHIPGTKYLGQVASTPVGFVTAKGSPLASVLQRAVNELIRNGSYAKILTKWGVTSSGVASSRVNPKPNF